MLLQRIAANFLLNWILRIFLLEYLIDKVMQALILLKLICLTTTYINFTRSNRGVCCTDRGGEDACFSLWTVEGFDVIFNIFERIWYLCRGDRWVYCAKTFHFSIKVFCIVRLWIIQWVYVLACLIEVPSHSLHRFFNNWCFVGINLMTTVNSLLTHLTKLVLFSLSSGGVSLSADSWGCINLSHIRSADFAIQNRSIIFFIRIVISF